VEGSLESYKEDFCAKLPYEGPEVSKQRCEELQKYVDDKKMKFKCHYPATQVVPTKC
jgi:hypothetical protein